MVAFWHRLHHRWVVRRVRIGLPYSLRITLGVMALAGLAVLVCGCGGVKKDEEPKTHMIILPYSKLGESK